MYAIKITCCLLLSAATLSAQNSKTDHASAPVILVIDDHTQASVDLEKLNQLNGGTFRAAKACDCGGGKSILCWSGNCSRCIVVQCDRSRALSGGVVEVLKKDKKLTLLLSDDAKLSKPLDIILPAGSTIYTKK